MSSADRISELEETVLQLRGALQGRTAFPPEWKLTPQQTALLGCILTSPGHYADYQRIAAALSTDDRGMASLKNSIHVAVCKLRQKLPNGIRIQNNWQAFFINREDAAKLRQFLVTSNLEDA